MLQAHWPQYCEACGSKQLQQYPVMVLLTQLCRLEDLVVQRLLNHECMLKRVYLQHRLASGMLQAVWGLVSACTASLCPLYCILVVQCLAKVEWPAVLESGRTSLPLACLRPFPASTSCQTTEQHTCGLRSQSCQGALTPSHVVWHVPCSGVPCYANTFNTSGTQLSTASAAGDPKPLLLQLSSQCWLLL